MLSELITFPSSSVSQTLPTEADPTISFRAISLNVIAVPLLSYRSPIFPLPISEIQEYA